MITATIPTRFAPERHYVLRVLVEVCLEGNVVVEAEDATSDVTLLLPSGAQLVLEDAFWRHLPEQDGYLLHAPLPGAPQPVPALPGVKQGAQPLVLLYGTGRIDQQGRTTHLGADLLASAFYLLTGWAEWAYLQAGHPPDAHGRYPEEAHWLVQHGLFQQPLVEAYAAFIREWAAAEGYHFPPQAPARVLPTHDIDRWRLGNTWHKRMWINLHQRAGSTRYAQYLPPGQALSRAADPYAGDEVFRSLAAEAGLTPVFFFKPTQQVSPYDAPYRLPRQAASQWGKGAMSVGFHPGYRAATHAQPWQAELARLTDAFGKPEAVRGHFLKESLPFTWRWAEAAGIAWDSTRGFSQRSGFRTGLCRPYPLFDFLARREMRLWETPLLFMESAHLPEGAYQVWPQPAELAEQVQQLQRVVQQYGGQFVFNWHNDHVLTSPYAPYAAVLRSLYRLP